MRAAPAAEAPAPVEAPAAMAEAPPAAATAPDMPTAPAMPEAPAAHEMAETPAMTATLTPQPAVRDVPPRSDAPATTVTQPPRPAVRPTPDDLTRIEGIGPATAKALNAGGITTFQQLADADSAQVNDILRNAGVRVSDPGTWGQQAKLAAAGDWARLKKLQDKLVGGRKA